MKSLIKKIIHSDFGIFLRNSLNIYPLDMDVNKLENASVSDAFAWRTDNNFTTKFKYSDILNIFYKVKDSWVEIHFYNKHNRLINTKKINKLSISNEINITPEYLNNIKDYGTFFIYHYSNEVVNIENIISNRCYLGYSQNENLFSFAHGNTLARFKNISNKPSKDIDIIKTSFFKNQTYKIQKYFSGFDRNELFFTNPTSKLIEFTIDDVDYKLSKGCSRIIDISKKKVISIQTNCLFLRPVVFSYKDEYLDVHHS
tara:strand:- start:11323 stop:12093 length:771 start_codon:yes stop_codon:yes gene_type:complete